MDPSFEARIDGLLARMTLEEKVGQLTQITPDWVPDTEERIRRGQVGSLLSIADPVRIEHYQRIAQDQSRLKIPLIVGNDVIHGYRTIFPIPLAESCTWDPLLLERAATAAAEEASANGTDWIFAPMVDVSRDPRWGRIAEGSGEDPFLGGQLAAARVRGFQASGLSSGRQVAACPKHYVAYGAAEAGRDYNAVDVSERTLREVFLPPFKEAFDAGADTAMSAFNEIGGVPASANPFTLRTILRGEWGWPGLVVSDYTAIRELIEHGVAADLREAARLSFLAGVDMDMMSDAYHEHLAALVTDGSIPEALVDEAVRRVLRLKLRLGLFERRAIDVRAAGEALLTEPARALALEVARASMVLLKNDGGVLPLLPQTRIAVVGPLADARADLLGCWAPLGRAEDVESVRDCIARDRAGSLSDVGSADVVVAVVGEPAGLSGEAHSRAHLGLPFGQQEFIDGLAATGKPLVVVLMTGRPLVIPRLVEQARALLVAWHGGIRAGQAVADLLFGAAEPSGRLTATWPRAEGQIPVYYAHKNTGRPVEGEGTLQFEEPFKSTYLDEPNAPLFPFGFGLSYTSFSYTDLALETPSVGLDGALACSACVTNTGERSGVETIQLYVRDLVASVTRPVRELKGFVRVRLQPGESQTVRFEVPIRSLGFIGVDNTYVVEPGEFQLWIAPDATRGLSATFRVQAR
jgi:beta-glucosidase